MVKVQSYPEDGLEQVVNNLWITISLALHQGLNKRNDSRLNIGK